MDIQQMFQDDINRKINGVVKVDQDTGEILFQELSEYVITRELRRHFITFFTEYAEAFTAPTADIGVWISGFFGSGKSHFLKILSCILSSKEVQGVRTSEIFRRKLTDDPEIFSLIESASQHETETILFNIDIEGFVSKDKTAVLRVFAKMFYNHLGFYGEDLKLARLEQFIAMKGKTEEFYRVFQAKNGGEWKASRSAYAFYEDDITDTLQEVLGMSEASAHNWFNGTEAPELSIAQLVSEIRDYVNTKPADFRLLFMADEVGQYVGGDTDLLLNLQSLAEKIGSECGGKVWLVCTGQEAIDEIIRTRENEFSRIQARFRTRLSLSSSSVDEVIQKRILRKTPEASSLLEHVYSSNEAVLQNLFTFSHSVSDIKGYSSSAEFVINFPFVPYQFILMQKVFAEIRRHGNSGKHLSGGERSMLSGFQEAAQKIRTHDENSLAPLYLFYDTVHSFLDSTIRRVIERCEKAAQDGNGIEPQDVDTLKLLYLVRYIDDIRADTSNIVILMAGNISLDKIVMRERVQASLDRLLMQNYIGRTGDTYNFLTDEEQDIQREIRSTPIDINAASRRISELIFGEIYQSRKFTYGRYNLSFTASVDGAPSANINGGMYLRILTEAADPSEKAELRLLTESHNHAVIVLGETSYYEPIERLLKVKKYSSRKNISKLPQSVQAIIRAQLEEASQREKSAVDELKRAIETGKFYASGDRISIIKGDAKSRIDQTLQYLASHMYIHMNLITANIESDSDICAILSVTAQQSIPGTEPNAGALAKVEEYLTLQADMKRTVSMADIQSRYQAAPYGWREIDIAAVVAQLIHARKVTVKHYSIPIQPDDKKLPDMLRKRTETGKTVIAVRQALPAQKIRDLRNFLREYFSVMDVPEDEDGLGAYITDSFRTLRNHYSELISRYGQRSYPGRAVVDNAYSLMNDILQNAKDTAALADKISGRRLELLDSQEDMQEVEAFFQTQAGLFDEASKFQQDIRVDDDYLKDTEAYAALQEIRAILDTRTRNYNYRNIPKLNELMQNVKAQHDSLIEAKKAEILEIIRQCMAEIHQSAGNNQTARNFSVQADKVFAQKKDEVQDSGKLRILDGLIPSIWQCKDDTKKRIDALGRRGTPIAPAQETREKKIRRLYRQTVFDAKTLSTEAEIDTYIEAVRMKMKQLLKNFDAIRLE